MAILLAIRVFGARLRGSYCRIRVGNVSAMYACLNGYSGNPYMARLAGEICMEILRLDIAPWWQYVPSKLNVAGIFSRPEKVSVGDRWSREFLWKTGVCPFRVFAGCPVAVGPSRGGLGRAPYASTRWAPSVDVAEV
jgi:hypothetical protein